MTEFFKGVNSEDNEGFTMCNCGMSGNGNTYVVTSNGMKSTELADRCPEVAEPKLCAELIAKLLNEYYNR